MNLGNCSSTYKRILLTGSRLLVMQIGFVPLATIFYSLPHDVDVKMASQHKTTNVKQGQIQKATVCLS